MGYRRIYYDINTGVKLAHVAFQFDPVNKPTIEQDIESIEVLYSRVRSSFDCLELGFDEYSQDFLTGTLTGVNVQTKTPTFAYDVEEDPPQVPLSVQVAELKQEQALIKAALDELLLGGAL
ncbi:hypothetical protein [Paenibacillus sp. NFR01]|uniref:hypothetical protein n=1 Tax=Paenibacillus sp. NFR01 TaxID=1566279 RepID=UPI0008BF546B|nr:hypothetical protein [Paenibacillus sp. NFR01]SET62043.1 hypothetical protein SAMN03159358_2207 [Paenibacillus sp. NFR01]